MMPSLEGPKMGKLFPPVSWHLLTPRSCPLPSSQLSPPSSAFKRQDQDCRGYCQVGVSPSPGPAQSRGSMNTCGINTCSLTGLSRVLRPPQSTLSGPPLPRPSLRQPRAHSSTMSSSAGLESRRKQRRSPHPTPHPSQMGLPGS